MCFLTKCEICGEIMEYEDYFPHSKVCKPELEKVEVIVEQNSREKKKKVK